MLCPIQAGFFSYLHWLHCSQIVTIFHPRFISLTQSTAVAIYIENNYLEYDVPFMKLACFMRWKIKLKLACLHWDEDNFFVEYMKSNNVSNVFSWVEKTRETRLEKLWDQNSQMKMVH